MEKKIDGIVVGDIQTNCWFYPLEAESPPGKQPCVVIDPGEEAALIINRLEKLNWMPHYIFLSHGHFDHLAALPDLLEYFGKGNDPLPKVGIHRLDALYLGKDAYTAHRDSISIAAGSCAYLDALWKPLVEADIFFEEGNEAGPFNIVHTPGHTPGSVCFYDEKARILFSGDTLFRMGWGRTDLPGGDETQLRQSLARLLSMDKEIVVCPGHGPATTIGNEAGLGY